MDPINRSPVRMAGKESRFLIPVAIFITALGIRVVDLGQFLTADEPRAWLGWSIEFIQAILEGRLVDTYYNFAPGVTNMWLGSLGLYLAYLFSPQHLSGFAEFLQDLPFDPIEPSLIFWFRLPNAVVGAVCLVLAYPFARRLLGTRAALISGLLIALDPLLIGLNRVLGSDGLATSFTFVSTLAALVFFVDREKPTYGNLVLSAIFAGLAILSKMTAAYLILFVGFVVVVVLVFRQQSEVSFYIRSVLIWSILVVLTVYVLFPALWFRPVSTVQEWLVDLDTVVTEPHNRGSFFMGQPVLDPGFWFYWVDLYFRLTAIATIGLILGAIRWLLRIKAAFDQRAEEKIVGFLLFSFVVFYLIFLSLGDKKQDRYIAPALPIIGLIAAYGYGWLIDKLRHRAYQYLSIALIIGLQATIVLSSYPYYLSHYNLLAGGGAVASKTILVGWGEGLDLAAGYLNAMPNAEDLKVSSWYHSTFEPFFNGKAVERIGDEKNSRSAKPALASDYVVLYINQIQRQVPTPGMVKFYRSFPCEHVVIINAIDYATICPSPAVEYMFLGQVRLVGQAELLGYNLLGEQGESILEIPSNGSAMVQLYWQWEGRSPDDLIQLSLVDEQGNTWGWGYSRGTQERLPFDQWDEGMIAYDEFELVVFPGTPPGDYYLNVWIDRPSAQEVVGVFPLDTEDARVTVSRPVVPPTLADLSLSEVMDVPLVNGIRLLGVAYDKQPAERWLPGQSRNLILYWQAQQAIGQNHTMALGLEDERGVERSEWTGLAVGGRFPAPNWKAGEIVRDPMSLTLPAYVPPGDYQLTVESGEGSSIPLFMVSVGGRSRTFEVPHVGLPLNAIFGDAIELTGLQAPVLLSSDISPGQPFTLVMVWRGTDVMAADYTVTLQLLDAQNQVRAQHDSMPLDGMAPTSSWAVGEVLQDSITLDIPADIGPGPHHLLVALYRVETGERVPVTQGPFAGQDHVEIPLR